MDYWNYNADICQQQVSGGIGWYKQAITEAKECKKSKTVGRVLTRQKSCGQPGTLLQGQLNRLTGRVRWKVWACNWLNKEQVCGLWVVQVTGRNTIGATAGITGNGRWFGGWHAEWAGDDVHKLDQLCFTWPCSGLWCFLCSSMVFVCCY